jgi:dolichol-phosphate mannosyltransferase
LWVNHLMTSRSLRPRTLRDAMRQWTAFYASRWSDVPLNAGSSIALCAMHCPWPLAVMVAVLVAELRYHIGRRAGAVA